MNSEEYDVIIVGAGVSGLMLAKLLNETKLRVLLVENRDTIKTPWNHRYGTTTEVVSKFGLEPYVIKKYNGFEFLYSHVERSGFSYTKDEFCTVDITPFAQSLELRFEVKTSTTISDIKREGGRAVVTDGSGTVYKTKIIVDCSGESKIVSKYLGQIKKGKPIDFYSISLELENCDIPDMSSFRFIADLTYFNAPLWFYPYSGSECQFGSTEWLTEYPNETKEYEKIFRFMKTESPYKEWFKNSTIKEKVFKIGPAGTINVSLAEDNFLACGNAAGAGTPVVGEGFRVALEMAKSAYDTVVVACTKGDFSKKTLMLHEQTFNSNFGKYYDHSTLLRFFVINLFTEREYRLMLRNLGRLSLEESKQMLKSQIHFGHLTKVLGIRLSIYLAINWIKFLIGGRKPLTRQTA